MKSLLSFVGLVAVATATTGILQPIYIYPETPDWTATYAAIRAHPELPWQVIINPNSGPCCYVDGVTCSPTPGCPAQNWGATVSQLNQLNVTTLGYVNVARTNVNVKNETKVREEIDLFAQWNSVESLTPGTNLVINGIFFDDSGYNESQLPKQKEYVSYAYNAHPNFRTFALNLGQMPDTNDYFDIIPNANIEVVIWETCWVNPGDPSTTPPPIDCLNGAYVPFNLSVLDQALKDHPLDATQKAKSAVLVHGVRNPHDPSLSSAVLRSELQGLVDRGIGWTAWVSQGWATTGSFTTAPVSIGEVAEDLASIQSP